MSALSLVTGPSLEPVTVDEAKRHLRQPLSDDDDVIRDCIAAARERVELETGRQLLTATWDLWLNSPPGYGSADAPVTGAGAWPGASVGINPWMDWSLWRNRRFIDMPRPPLQQVLTITYVDTSGVTQTWDSSQYQVHAPAGPTAPRGRVQPAYGVNWPVTRDQMDAFTVRFVAGYGDKADAVPQMLRRAILLITGDWYENREATVVTDRRVTVQALPYGVDQILQQYRARPILRAA